MSTTLRNYKIEIKGNNGYLLPEGLPTELICSVSEGSGFSNVPRGLSFSDKDGHLLIDHPVFVQRVRFVKMLPGNPPEQAEIDQLVWSCLAPYRFPPGQVSVVVTYQDTVQV